jgi:predicted dehydrogenase
VDQGKAIVGFIGAGGIARAHAFAINSVPYYYNSTPAIELEAVCSTTEENRILFAKKYGFNRSVDLEGFISDMKINTVFILGPNKVHYEHLKAVIGMAAIKSIYLEKPVCSNAEEEKAIKDLTRLHPGIKIQVGFQFLFAAAVREALTLWKSGIFGKPIHFDFKYFHGDYLRKEYRDKRVSRLTPAPDGGAMADLGSHALSMLIAFLGDKLHITSGLQTGWFRDVTEESDLVSQIFLFEESTKAAGSVSASRISSGTGDLFSFDLYAEKGALRYSTASPDFFEFYLEETGRWNKQAAGSNFKPITSFPSEHVPAGWLRSMIHAHYVFLTGNDEGSFVPGIEHGLAVQSLVAKTAEYLQKFRKNHLI